MAVRSAVIVSALMGMQTQVTRLVNVTSVMSKVVRDANHAGRLISRISLDPAPVTIAGLGGFPQRIPQVVNAVSLGYQANRVRNVNRATMVSILTPTPTSVHNVHRNPAYPGTCMDLLRFMIVSVILDTLKLTLTLHVTYVPADHM